VLIPQLLLAIEFGGECRRCGALNVHRVPDTMRTTRSISFAGVRRLSRGTSRDLVCARGEVSA